MSLERLPSEQTSPEPEGEQNVGERYSHAITEVIGSDWEINAINVEGFTKGKRFLYGFTKSLEGEEAGFLKLCRKEAGTEPNPIQKQLEREVAGLKIADQIGIPTGLCCTITQELA